VGQILKMRISHDRGRAVVWLCGELDVAEAAEARAFLLAAAIDGRGRLVVDVTDLVFVDASGLSTLAFVARQTAQDGGWLRLVDASPLLRRMLRIVDLTAVLPVYESVHAAIIADTSGTGTAPEGGRIAGRSEPHSALPTGN